MLTFCAMRGRKCWTNLFLTTIQFLFTRSRPFNHLFTYTTFWLCHISDCLLLAFILWTITIIRGFVLSKAFAAFWVFVISAG